MIRMLRLLFDENISDESADYVQRLFGIEVFSIARLRLKQAIDQTVLTEARTHRAIVVTLDLDFGFLFRFQKPPKTGVIILRLKDQTVESVNRALTQLIESNLLDRPANSKALLVVREHSIRIYR